MNLKKIILGVTMLMTLTAFSQNSTKIEYFKIWNLNISDLQDYMHNKGYDFFETGKDEFGTKYTWTLNKNKFKKAEKFFTLFMDTDNEKGEFSLQTTNKEDYIEFKNTIKNNGLKFDGIENKNDGSLIENYSNSNYLARLTSNGDNLFKLNFKKI